MLEDRFLDVPTSSGALENAAVFAQRPHYAGSDGDYKLAYFVRDKFKEYGLDAVVEPLTARIDTPRKLALELVPTGARPVTLPAYTALASRKKKRAEIAAKTKGVDTAPADGFDLRELPDPADPETANPAVGLPFLAGSGDGDVTGPLVYAGHGTAADYAILSAHGIDVKGAVVLMRFGAEPRGALVRRAQGLGAIAAVLFDDPADDGAGRGAVYPERPVAPDPLGAARQPRRGRDDPRAADLGLQRASAARCDQGALGARPVVGCDGDRLSDRARSGDRAGRGQDEPSHDDALGTRSR